MLSMILHLFKNLHGEDLYSMTVKQSTRGSGGKGKPMNKVYESKSNKPLQIIQIVYRAQKARETANATLADYVGEKNRLAGRMCNCNGNGEFELLPAEDPMVSESGKALMFCRRCGRIANL